MFRAHAITDKRGIPVCAAVALLIEDAELLLDVRDDDVAP